jgi:hypothetical protein
MTTTYNPLTRHRPYAGCSSAPDDHPSPPTYDAHGGSEHGARLIIGVYQLDQRVDAHAIARAQPRLGQQGTAWRWATCSVKLTVA